MDFCLFVCLIWVFSVHLLLPGSNITNLPLGAINPHALRSQPLDVLPSSTRPNSRQASWALLITTRYKFSDWQGDPMRASPGTSAGTTEKGPLSSPLKMLSWWKINLQLSHCEGGPYPRWKATKRRPEEGREPSLLHHQSTWIKLSLRMLNISITPANNFPFSLQSAWLQFLTLAINIQPEGQQEFDTFQWPKGSLEVNRKKS